MKKIRKTKLIFEATVVIAVALALTMPSSAVVTDKETNAASMDPVWEDGFDDYTLGQFLDGEPEDGGWKGWDDTPAAGAYVVDTENLTPPHSVDIVGDTDLVREYQGLVAGQFTYTAWQYVPEDFSGTSYFILLSHYEDFGGQDINKWAVQIRFDSELDVAESEYDDISLPLITGRWVELRTEIDLDADWFTFYYDGEELISKAWTAGPNNAGDGYLEISAVDLYAAAATSVYYDNMSLVGKITLMPDLEITINSGIGIGVGATISNVGEAEATDVEWTIHVTGGILKLIDKKFTGTVSSIDIDADTDIQSGMILGLGKIAITVSAECAEGDSEEVTEEGTQILIFTSVS